MIDKGVVSFVSLGCAKNIVDSEVMLGQLAEAGFTITPEATESDIVVINTCGFLEAAKDEAMQYIRGAIELRQKGMIRGVIVAGCLSQRLGPDGTALFDGVDAVIGVTNKEVLVDICRSIMAGSCSNKVVHVDEKFPVFENDTARLRITPKHYGYLRISEGCNHDCSFCIIPKIRGAMRSKPVEQVCEEARQLVDSGARELIVIAEDTNEYGFDNYRKPMIVPLLKALAKIDGLDWLRLMYCYPTFVTKEFCEEIRDNPKVVKYVDMPIQHTRDRMLKLMRRGIIETKQRQVIDMIRETVPGVVLRTSIIVGFPGETDDEFDGLMRDLHEIAFDRLGTFMYSREKGTAAFDYPDQAAENVKQERYAAVMKQQANILDRSLSAMHGGAYRGFIEGLERGKVIARLETDAPEIDCTVQISARKTVRSVSIGTMTIIKVSGHNGYNLYGELTDDVGRIGTEAA